jgi:hypothetical protein
VIRAAAVVLNVSLPEPRADAIEVDLEHVEGVAVAVTMPYTRQRFLRRMRYGTMSAQRRSRRIWGDS